jgi:co-chaperonin GroES (HSP10)
MEEEMKDIKPLRDNVLGRMIDIVGGERQTRGGIIITEDHSSSDFVRPRWFQVTHVGPKQEDISVGQYVLVPHGRWSRGIDMVGSQREEDKIFLIDHDDVLGISDEVPA